MQLPSDSKNGCGSGTLTFEAPDTFGETISVSASLGNDINDKEALSNH